MNERIRSLALKAKLGSAEFDNGIRYYVSTEESFERFALLILQDCMDVVDGYTKGRTFDTHYDAVAQIEQLFGIKHKEVE